MENVKFLDAEHQEAYERYLKQVPNITRYNKSLLYLLTMTEDTRKHIESIYDFELDQIEFETLKEAWQTSTTIVVCKLAFNLFNGFVGEEDADAKYYSVDSIFSVRESLLPYFLQAIQLKYEK